MVGVLASSRVSAHGTFLKNLQMSGTYKANESRWNVEPWCHPRTQVPKLIGPDGWKIALPHPLLKGSQATEQTS